MEKKENGNELQSRRDFFKKAAKGTLPILGAIALAGTPGIVKAAEETMGCDWGCAYGCSGGCSRVCSMSCSGSCRGQCSGACSYSCQNTCKGSCHGSCNGGCSSMNSF